MVLFLEKEVEVVITYKCRALNPNHYNAIFLSLDFISFECLLICFAIFYVFGVLFFLRFYLIEDYVGKWKKLLTPSLIICFYFETFVGKGENFD